MHRIDTSTAVAAMPTPAAAGTAGYFQEGNPLTGTTGTFISADWLNTVMMELVNILTAAGVTPSKTVQNQVLTSMQTLFGGAGTNGATGSRTLAGGTIIKWGTDTTTAGVGSKAIIFTTAFPTACVSVQLTHGVASANAQAFGYSSASPTGFTAWGASTAAGGFSWFAVGY